MKKIILSGILLFFVFQFHILGQIPVGYYNPIDEKQERELKTALHRVLRTQTVLNYADAWYYFWTTDARPENTSIVWDMYSGTIRYFNSVRGRSTAGMDREHSLPVSWWGTSPENTTFAAYTDLNHLYPSDRDANQEKSNYPLGMVANPHFNNGVTKVGRNIYPGAPSQSAFEPADEYKGDFARTYMYMVTRYEDYAQRWRSEALQMFNRETYPVFQNWAKNMLLEWHRNDPVSEKERARNEEVFLYQNNRNPFIDFPQLAEYIWGDSVSYVFRVPEQYFEKEPQLITPTNRSNLFFGEIPKNTETSQTVTLRGINMRGNVSIMLWGGNREYFRLSSNSAPASMINSEEGYVLEVFYNPQEYGEHQTMLVIQDGGMEGSSVVHLRGICGSGSSLISIDAEFPDLYVQNNTIHFRTYTPNDNILIYDAVGKLIFSENGTGKWQEFNCSQAGLYIILLNGNNRKIIVK